MAAFTPTQRAAILARIDDAKAQTGPWADVYAQDVGVLLAFIDFLSRKRDQAYDCSVRDSKAKSASDTRLKEAKKLFKEIEKRFKGV